MSSSSTEACFVQIEKLSADRKLQYEGLVVLRRQTFIIKKLMFSENTDSVVACRRKVKESIILKCFIPPAENPCSYSSTFVGEFIRSITAATKSVDEVVA